MGKKTQIEWMNAAKFVAIFCVMMDHTEGLLYTSKNVAYAIYYSVSLFILLSGMTSYLSDGHHEGETWLQSVIRGCRKILGAYCMATALNMIVESHGLFDFGTYVRQLLLFNGSGQFYFVLLYIQLMLVNRLLYGFLQKCPFSVTGYLMEAAVLVLTVLFAWWSVNFTNILGVYGGGGKLLGGTYLVLYYIGMLLMRHVFMGRLSAKQGTRVTSGFSADEAVDTAVQGEVRGRTASMQAGEVRVLAAPIQAGLLVIFGLVFFLYWRYQCVNGFKLDLMLPFGNGELVPSITFATEAFCMLLVCCGLFGLLGRKRYTAWLAHLCSWLGQYSMPIFLYHIMVLYHVCLHFFPNLPEQNIWLARLVFYPGMVLGSIVIDRALHALGNAVGACLKRV